MNDITMNSNVQKAGAFDQERDLLETRDCQLRNIFWDKVYELVKRDNNVVIVTADFGSPVIDNIKKNFPKQLVNVGIAEQNAILIAAGLALTGKKIFVTSCSTFITFRCLEQIRIMSGIMKIPMTIVGMESGFSMQVAGPTHWILEDTAIMRAMPNILIHSISDYVMASAIAERSYDLKTTNYVRLDKFDVPVLYDKDEDFSKGFSVLKEGRKYIVTTGGMTQVAMNIVKILGKEGIDIGVIDVYEIPIPESGFITAIKDAEKLVTLEEQFLPGGFSSAICEVLIDNEVLVPVKRIGVSHLKGYCYIYGGRKYIHEHYGIDPESISREVKQYFK